MTLTGKTLGKYHIIARLGRGGMADVYKAYHPRLDRYVAIKVLHSHLVEGTGFLERFEREARAVAALRHPHIVQVYDFDVEGEIYYMVMEFIDGGTLTIKLEELSKRGERLPLAEAVRIFCEIAGALDYAHHQQMLHRDVKPSNVLLNASGRAFLTDFGIARILSDSRYTATGALIGTPAYMSPEQGQGRQVTVASDIYSLGVVLYELVTGRIPFDADTPIAIVHKHINDPPPFPHVYYSGVPDSLERVILKALAKDPEDRFQSAADMARSVGQVLDLEPNGVALPTMEPSAIVKTPPPAEVTEVMEEPIPRESEVPVQKTLAGPTVAMEEPLIRVGSPLPPTVAMVEESAETTADSAPEVEPSAEIAAVEFIPKKLVGGQAGHQVPPRRLKPLPIALGVISVVIVAALAIFLGPQLFGSGAECANLEECLVMSEEAESQGERTAAVTYLERALDFVPANEHPPHAELWCRLGENNVSLGRVDEAVGDFERCIEWTEGDPALEGLRVLASEQIGSLQP